MYLLLCIEIIDDVCFLFGVRCVILKDLLKKNEKNPSHTHISALGAIGAKSAPKFNPREH